MAGNPFRRQAQKTTPPISIQQQQNEDAKYFEDFDERLDPSDGIYPFRDLL